MPVQASSCRCLRFVRTFRSRGKSPLKRQSGCLTVRRNLCGDMWVATVTTFAERSAPRWAEGESWPGADESVGKPDSVAHRERRGAIIHLRPLLPAAWCDLPGGLGEQPSGASADARTRPLDLAPGGVCRATPVTWGAGGLLHHRFTLTSEEAVCSLWHFPAGHPGWALPTTVLCGVRTFLDPPRKADRDRLTDSSKIQANACPSIDETRRDRGRHELDADRRI